VDFLNIEPCLTKDKIYQLPWVGTHKSYPRDLEFLRLRFFSSATCTLNITSWYYGVTLRLSYICPLNMLKSLYSTTNLHMITKFGQNMAFGKCSKCLDVYLLKKYVNIYLLCIVLHFINMVLYWDEHFQMQYPLSIFHLIVHKWQVLLPWGVTCISTCDQEDVLN
jgi:hypothetical protein